MPQFNDIDHLAAQLVQTPKQSTPRSRQNLVTNVLLLKKSIELLPELNNFLAKCNSPLLKLAAANLDEKNTACQSIKNQIDTVLDANATIAKKLPTRMRVQIAFAIKSGVDGLLDVARGTFAESIEEIHALVEKIKQEVECTDIRQGYSVSRGYHLSVPATIFQIDTLDTSRFVQCVRRGTRVNCSTEELLSLEERQKDSFNEIVVMSERVLQNLLVEIRRSMGWMFVFGESLAFVDLMLCFANTVSLNDGFVRPEFFEEGPIAVKQGKHPILHVLSPQLLVANNCFLSETNTFHLVTGPNCSGKTTYLKQMGLLTILAHLGSYVPAEYASFRLTDQVFTCLQHGDRLESNAGSFFTECCEVSYGNYHLEQ